MAKTVRFHRQSQDAFYKLFLQLCGVHSAWEVWADFVSMSAISIANAFDQKGAVHDDRERQYQERLRRYPKEEWEVFPKLLTIVVLALEEDPEQDFLGEMFSSLELHNHWRGQFFTPYPISHFVAMSELGNIEAQLDKKGWVGVNDPACGAGVLLVAVRNVMVQQNIPSTAALYVAQDIDRTAALMCYLQLALLGCAGYVVVADTLQSPLTGHLLCPSASPEHEVWYLPMYFHKVWQQRIQCHRMDTILSCAWPRAEIITDAPPPPPPKSAAPPLIPELNVTSTGQLTLF